MNPSEVSGRGSLSSRNISHMMLFGDMLMLPHSISGESLPFHWPVKFSEGLQARPVRKVNAFLMSWRICAIEQQLPYYQLCACILSPIFKVLSSRSVVGQWELRGTEM